VSSLHGRTVDGKYLVEHCLGEGGMGSVFLAQHLALGRTVALKVVQAELLADPASIERFKREARAAGGLRHPNIVNVTDFGVADVDGRSTAYLVMEYLSGETLARVLETRGRLPLRVVDDIVAQIAEALAAAHEQGTVHRDLKPANIWLTPDARGSFRVTLLDFGIAKLRDQMFELPMAAVAAPDASEATMVRPTEYRTPNTTEPFTRVGQIVGTPAYMSPEQCAGGEVDHRSDVYSLAVVVYRMLTGEVPFTGDAVELLRQHRDVVPPLIPSVSKEVAAVIARALAKKPEDRYQSARAFAGALQAYSAGTTEALRRAVALFAERMPELLRVSLWFPLPALVAVALTVLAPPIARPFVGAFAGAAALIVVAATAMASIATVFDDVRNRPFVPISWRTIAERVGGGGLWRWFGRSTASYLRAWILSRSHPIRTMFAFIAPYRQPDLSEERLERMVRVFPRRTFDRMVLLQVTVLFAIPAITGLAGHTARIGWITAGVTFAFVQVLQTLMAIVDVMMFDLAWDATGD
jgi:tRNA A-37 threonylcarbamoyl transferase component Bud32